MRDNFLVADLFLIGPDLKSHNNNLAERNESVYGRT